MDQEKQKKLREECFKPMASRTIPDCLEMLDIFIDYFAKVAHHDASKTMLLREDLDAVTVNQMLLSKLLHLRKLLEGVSCKTAAFTIENFSDPTIVASIIRNIYETVGVFYLINTDSNSAEERRLKYLLWSIAGLRYRQRFTSNATTAENLAKAVKEEKEIQEMIAEVKASNLYNSLAESEQGKIDQVIRKKEYRITLNGGNVNILDWQSLTNLMKCNPKLFNEIYTYFSLYAHPSNVAVFQFRDMFGEDEQFKSLLSLVMRFCFTLTGIFISSYIKLFPDVMPIFEGLSLKDQILLNYHNRMVRGDNFSVNSAWKNLQ